MKKINRKDRILVSQPYGIGDALFMLPLLKALKLQKGAEQTVTLKIRNSDADISVINISGANE